MNLDELAIKAKSGDLKAQNDLIIQMQRYIRKTANSMAVGLPADDCEQELSIAILGLTKTWNPNCGATFFTYCYAWAPKKAFRNIGRFSCPVSLPQVNDIQLAAKKAIISPLDNESEADATDRVMAEAGQYVVPIQQAEVEHNEVKNILYATLGKTKGTALWLWACGEPLGMSAAILGVGKERARHVLKQSIQKLREVYGTDHRQAACRNEWT